MTQSAESPTLAIYPSRDQPTNMKAYLKRLEIIMRLSEGPDWVSSRPVPVALLLLCLVNLEVVVASLDLRSSFLEVAFRQRRRCLPGRIHPIH